MNVIEDRLLRIDDCLRIVPLGKSTFWKYVAEGKLPAPIRLGKATMWKHSDMMAFVASGAVGHSEPQTPARAA